MFNKVDKLRGQAEAAGADRAAISALHDFAEYIPISALEGRRPGRAAAAKSSTRLPEGPALYPADYLTDQPERFLAAEILREKILHLTRQEVPHAVAVMIETWEDTPKAGAHRRDHLRRAAGPESDPDRRGRRGLKKIGTLARQELETTAGKQGVSCRPSSRSGRTGAQDPEFLAAVGLARHGRNVAEVEIWYTCARFLCSCSWSRAGRAACSRRASGTHRDDRIYDDVRRKLANDPGREWRGLDVTVKDGVVTLNGQSPHREGARKGREDHQEGEGRRSSVVSEPKLRKSLVADATRVRF